ncbi:GAF domain-containing protein [Flavobacteriaceae bacterium F08102]|nr:GAF domain-containing protein [Flavobacteriaceae bacterium F08102]
MAKLIAQNINKGNLPFQFQLGFDKVIEHYRNYVKIANHPYADIARKILSHVEKNPILIEGFTDLDQLETYKEEINLILNPLFPRLLSSNEIKAAIIPFTFYSFRLSDRFEKIIENAGEGYEFEVRNYEENELYIMACVIILNYCYGYKLDLKRPFFFDIPDKNTGIMMHYRVAINADFMEIIPNENAPKITEDDFKILLDNYENIEIWKEKFPLNSYVFKGFCLMNLFDVTAEESLSSLKDNLLRSDENLVVDLQHNLRKFFNINDLKLGFSIFDAINSRVCDATIVKKESIILNETAEIMCGDYFCEGIVESVFGKHLPFTISDVETYGKNTNQNPFYKNLKKNGIRSIILIPIKATENDDLALLEIGSPRPYELNSVTLQKLNDILHVFKAAVKRSSEEHQNVLEATIQENYTTIHSSVKWRFYQAAEAYQQALSNGVENPKLEEIIFDDVYPLYGQADIRNSSLARNSAIKKDLITQLHMAIGVLSEACEFDTLPIYDELMFRVNRYLASVNKGLDAGDEIGILDFLQRDIYPVFKHIKNLNPTLSAKVDIYMNSLDAKLNVVYEERKHYENSVTILNDKLTFFLDKSQEEAQQMFPHYFERYKTDGVEFNMYIGQSLVHHLDYSNLYLYNLRLWQLTTMCQMENIAHTIKKELPHPLEIASLILIHSDPLSIRFRMDEKQFDVDGAYNVRYEIIKKRIDKANIKGTNQRLTMPGKIAIVYAQDKDAREYRKYINYLQSKNMLGKIEYLDVEDLQGVSGLKALRVEVIYHQSETSRDTMTIDQLLEGFKS